MSEIKVDKISPQSGVALEIGDSGDTITCSGTPAGFGGGKILQVVAGTIKTDTTTSTSTSFVTVTGMTATITPSATSSTILISCSFSECNDVGTNNPGYRIVRDSTAIFVGTSVSSRYAVSAQANSVDDNVMTGRHVQCIDTPSSTSAIVYALQWITPSGTMYFNRSKVDSDGAGYQRGASQIIVMEIGV